VPPPPKPADEGLSLEVTMKFIQEKLKAKLPIWADITADPATCQLTFQRDDVPDNETKAVKRSRAMSLREVEKIQVMTLEEFASLMRQDDPDKPGQFVLRILATTEKSVHTRLEAIPKRGKPTQRDYYSGDWSATFQDQDTADRLAKALLHAVELCGGGTTPEPF
jgi:hypothetical protein